MSGFPQSRLRRLRESAGIRALARETALSASNMLYPIFVTHGRNVREPIEPMPGCYRVSVDRLCAEAEEVASLGIPGMLLFGLPESKDAMGTGAYAEDGIVQRAARELKSRFSGGLLAVTDVCLCEYTDHGHCGVIDGERVDNDRSLELLARTAVSQAAAGADIVAPSAMMDGQVRAIREALDANGFSTVPIMGYSAKYASGFYGPFRVAADSAPQFGDRRSYQMDPANWRMALREAEQDAQEGADILMVKPALAFLDVIARVRERFDHPIAAYNVSGEYSMVKAAAANGWLDERRVTLEILTAIRRAGADILITYHAKDAARWLKERA